MKTLALWARSEFSGFAIWTTHLLYPRESSGYSDFERSISTPGSRE